jgi:outer membrane protein assembly factor BamA
VRRAAWIVLVSTALTALTCPVYAQQAIVASIQVHGNTLTPDDAVITASGLTPGQPYSDSLLDCTAQRLTATKRFQHVDVLKRYASITDPTQIVVLIQVDEGPVHIVPGAVPGQAPHVARRAGLSVMYLPLLDAEDGYGLTYGVQVALTGNSADGNRLAFPLSWGGNKRAGAEFQRDFASRRAPRLRAGAMVQRRTHPFYLSDADRVRTWIRGEWRVGRPFYIGATTAWQKAELLQRIDRTFSTAADLVVDTRIEPMLPGNAVYLRAQVERLSLEQRPVVRTELEANAYVGVYRGSVIVLRAAWDDASRAVPPFFKSVLGGADSLRGFRAGTAVGDTMAVASAELRIPLTSSLHIAKFGASLFVDAGTAYDNGEHFSNQHLKKGAGGGVWATAALFHVSVMVAHGVGSGNRVHFGAGLTF